MASWRGQTTDGRGPPTLIGYGRSCFLPRSTSTHWGTSPDRNLPLKTKCRLVLPPATRRQVGAPASLRHLHPVSCSILPSCTLRHVGQLLPPCRAPAFGAAAAALGGRGGGARSAVCNRNGRRLAVLCERAGLGRRGHRPARVAALQSVRRRAARWPAHHSLGCCDAIEPTSLA